MKSAEDYLKAAWQALLKGDLSERDKLCNQATLMFEAENRLKTGKRLVEGKPIKLSKDA